MFQTTSNSADAAGFTCRSSKDGVSHHTNRRLNPRPSKQAPAALRRATAGLRTPSLEKAGKNVVSYTTVLYHILSVVLYYTFFPILVLYEY